MRKKPINKISAEVLAAFLDGNATAKESKEILHALPEDAELRELLHISQLVDVELGLMSRECELIPMTAVAATCNEESFCCLECEKYILHKLNIEFDEQQLLHDAIKNGWQKEEGTALHNVGRHLENKGLVVSRQYKASIDDIVNALNDDECVIVAVDGGELSGCRAEEIKEDILIGEIPDHTVVVLSGDMESKTITIYDPNSSNPEDTYPLERFKDAWSDSKNYLVIIKSKNMENYVPKPIDTSDVELSKELLELGEAIAENAHDIWAVDRQAEGWTYGPIRDEKIKETPCMVPYSKLPENEKDYDRKMAMNTLRLMSKLGYDLIRREETDLYKELLKRIRDAKANEVCYCPYCATEGHRTPVFKGYVFCNRCGHKLDIDWDNLLKD